MTVSSPQNIVQYPGDNVSAVFPIPFYFLENTHIVATLTDVLGAITTLVQNVDYTLAGAGNQAGGALTTSVAVSSAYVLQIARDVPATQLTDYQPNDDFPAESHERALDKLTMLVQQAFSDVAAVDLKIGRTVRVPVPEFIPELPNAAARANNILGFDSLGNPNLSIPASGSSADLALKLADSLMVSQGAAMIGRGDQIVKSIAELRTLLSNTPSKHAFVTGYYAQGDGGGGHYYLDSVDVVSADNGGTVIVSGDGGRWKLAVTESVSVRQFGAKGDWNGTTGTNDTLAFQRAAATGLNVVINKSSNFLIRDMITLAATGQRIVGEDKYTSKVFVNSTFNLSALGIFRSAATGVEYENFTIQCVQPDTAIFANLTSYPPAVYGIDVPGQRVKSMVVTGAIVGFDWRDNVGQSLVDDLTLAAFSKGFRIDGCIDSLRFDKVHFWPANLTTNQTLIMTQPGGATAWDVGRCDDLKVTDCLTYCFSPFNFFSGTRANPGSCFGTITDCDMDGFGGITMSAGSISVVGGFQSAGQVSATKLNMSGGNLSYTGVQFQVGANFPAAVFSAWMNLSGSAVMSMTNCQIYKPNDACLFILAGNGKLLLTTNNFIYQPNTVFSLPMISAPAGTVVAIGNELSTLGGTGVQNFFTASVDGPHVVTKNHLYGAQISAPAGIGYYSDNIQGLINKDLYNNLVIGGIRTKTFTTTANGSGVASVAHGIAVANLKVLHVTALYKGASTEAVGIPAVSVDGTNITASAAGAASTKVRLSITYIETVDAGW